MLNMQGTIGITLRAGQHAVGLIVIGKSFSLGIPVKLSVQFHGNVADQADRTGAVPEFNR